MFAVSQNNRLAISAFVLATAIGIQCSERAQQETAAAQASFAVLTAVKSANGKMGLPGQDRCLHYPPAIRLC